MFNSLLYYLGFLPKIFQIVILIVFAIISYRTLTTSSSYTIQPPLALLVYYALTRLLNFVFGINNLTTILWIIVGIYFAYVLFERLGMLGIILFIVVLSWIFLLTNQVAIFANPIFNIIVILIGIHIISQFIEISFFRQAIYSILSIALTFFIPPAVLLEIVFLFEALIRCFFESFSGIDIAVKFAGLFVVCFLGVYLIEFAFAHFLLALIIFFVLRFIYKIIS